MVHDFMVTENHVLFPVLPLTGSLERAMSGKPVFAWEPEQGQHRLGGHAPRRGRLDDPLDRHRGLLRLPPAERV
jgi:carotenoid cleavage dioxygenase-like enzyme